MNIQPPITAAKPISIELGSASSRPYKTIDYVVWTDIPPFVVLTGLNGSGKTQLLEALAYKITRVRAPLQAVPLQALNDLPLRITGATVDPHEVAYLPSAQNRFAVQGSSLSDLKKVKENFLTELMPQNIGINIERLMLRERVRERFGVTFNNTQQDINRLPDDFVYMLDFLDVSSRLSHVFVGYQFRRAEMLMNRKDEIEVVQELGRPPWDFVNEALSVAGFPYRIVPPENKLNKDYSLKLITNGGTTEFDDLNDLSSGEKTILRTVLWFYNTKHNGIFPKLFLLDEPDAHLHPSMTRQFIDIVKGVLVDQFGVRVILTTHSPSTVALAPDDSIFVMHRELPRIRRPTSKAEAIGLLTSGLVTVSAGTKYVFVEDRDDVTFFSLIRDILADQGPSKDQMALAPAPSIVFMASSIGKKNKVQSGGKNVVAQWVAKFDTPPLKDMFSGLIDLDDGNAETPRLKVIGRYGIENYRLDPIVVFALLNEESKAPNIPGVEISTGNEHYLRDFPVNKLQLIIDVVANQIEPQLGLSDIQEKEQADVTFTNGVMLKYPKWMLTRRGHDLLRVYQNVFGSFITPPRLDKVYQRVRLVPKELAVIMTKLQKQ